MYQVNQKNSLKQLLLATQKEFPRIENICAGNDILTEDYILYDELVVNFPELKKLHNKHEK